MLSEFIESTVISKTEKEINFSDQETQEKSSENSTTLTKFDNLKLLEELDPQRMFEKFNEEKLKNWTYSNLKDEYRPENANKSSGGVDFKNKELVSLLRSTGYDILKQIGKKILSGDFNLTTISFPIKVMLPLTILQTIAKSVFQFPIYMNLAMMQIDPIEKFKLAIVATISCYHASSFLLKPLNPIIGETYEMMYEDGSKIYLEQSSHHPPISHFWMVGPYNSYKLHGFSNFTSSAGLNSLKVIKKCNSSLLRYIIKAKDASNSKTDQESLLLSVLKFILILSWGLCVMNQSEKFYLKIILMDLNAFLNWDLLRKSYIKY
jgi:hypothetical protein